MEKKSPYRAAVEDGDAAAAQSMGPDYQLVAAAVRGDCAEVSRLLDQGVPVDVIVNGRFNSTPLFHAAASGHLEAVKLLLDRGANVNHICNDSFTALTLAAASKHWDVVRLLASRGGDVQHVDGSGDSAIKCARNHAPSDLLAHLESM